MVKGFFRCDSVFGVRLQAASDEVEELGVPLKPVLLEIGDAVDEHGHVEILELLGFVADGHLVENDAVGPHVDGRRDPDVICHLRRLVVLRAHKLLHVGELFGLVRDDMAEAEVADLGNRQLLSV